jgi:hypothetical protein
MADQRRIEVRAIYDDLVALDFDFKWTALKDIQLVNTTDNSLFSMRVAPDISPQGNGTLMDSDARMGAKATHGKDSDWCAFFGRRRGPAGEVTEGIAMFNYPRNPWKECLWVMRDYGFASPSPFAFQKTPLRIEADETIGLHYHVLLFTGTPRDAAVFEVFKAWVQREDTEQ